MAAIVSGRLLHFSSRRKSSGKFLFGIVPNYLGTIIIGPFPQASDDRETYISLPPEYAGGDAMSVTTQILDSSRQSIVDAIDQAFEAVWRMLYSHMAPDSDQSSRTENRTQPTAHRLGRRWRNRSPRIAQEGAGEHGAPRSIEIVVARGGKKSVRLRSAALYFAGARPSHRMSRPRFLLSICAARTARHCWRSAAETGCGRSAASICRTRSASSTRR